MRHRQTTAVVALHLLVVVAASAQAQTQAQSQPQFQTPPPAQAQVSPRTAPAPAIAPAARPSHRGQWLTEGGKSRVEVYDCPPGICAKIVWLKEPNDENGKPLHDGYNKIKSLNTRPILGLPLFEKMLPAKSGWEGKVYNPEEGESFDVSVWLSGPDQISIKGCVLFICQTHNWNRAPAAPASAPASAATSAPAPAPGATTVKR